MSFPSNIKVWRQTSAGDYKQVKSGEESDSTSLPSTLPLKIEGIEESSSQNDVTVTATLRVSDSSFNDAVKLTVYHSSFLNRFSSPNPKKSAEPGSLANLAQFAAASTLPTEYRPLTRLYPYAANIRSRIVPSNPLSSRVGVDANDYIRWTIYGMGQISTDGKNWANTVQQRVPANGKPLIHFRANSVGFMRLILTNDKSKIVINYAFTAYKLNKLVEIGQPHNRLPALYPEKQKLSESFIYSAAYGERKRNALTLYVTSEPAGQPNNDKLKLLLDTSVQRVKGTPIYYWGVVKKAYSAAGVTTSLVQSGPLNVNGRAQVLFHPTGRYGEWEDETHMIGIGVDEDGDGLDKDEVVSQHYSSRYTKGPSLEVRAYNHDDYTSAKTRTKNDQMVSSHKLSVGAYFLYLFLNNKHSINAYGSNITYPTANGFADPIASGELSFVATRLAASDKRLTNIAGASFGTAGGASITRYLFKDVNLGKTTGDSVGAKKIKASTAFAIFTARKINDARAKAKASTSHAVGAVKIYPFTCNEDIEFKNPYPGMKAREAAIRDPLNYDLYVAIHGARIVGTGKVSLRRNANGTFTRTGFSFRGGVEDLWDFTPLSADKTQNGAALQSGFRSGNSLRPFGKIYTWRIDINK